DDAAVALRRLPARPAHGGRHAPPLPVPGSALRAGEQLRTDRVHRGRDIRAGERGRAPGCPAAHREADRRCPGPHPGRRPPPGPCGDGGRAVRRRRGRRPGLPRPARPDSGAVRQGPVLPGARRAPVQDRRPGPAPAGRPDRLPPPEAAVLLRDDGHIAPRTPVEKRVADILASLMGLERVGVQDNFFMLGGHSLLGTQLIARLRESFSVELSLRTIFETPTVEGLAAEVELLVLEKTATLSEDEAVEMLR